MPTCFRLCMDTFVNSSTLASACRSLLHTVFSCEVITGSVTAVRALNITFRSGNPCDWISNYEARLYASNIVLRTKTGTDLARAVGATLTSRSVAGATNAEPKALDTSNTTCDCRSGTVHSILSCMLSCPCAAPAMPTRIA